MSKIKITEDEVKSRIDIAVKSTKNNLPVEFRSHNINPLSIEELTSIIRIIGINKDIILSDMNNLLKTGYSKYTSYDHIILFKTSFVVKQFKSEKEFIGSRYEIDFENNSIKLTYQFHNKQKIN